MSSNNPFRRSKVPDSTVYPSATYGTVDANDNTPATPPPRTKKKRVKIQTPPPLSPELTHSPDHGRRLSASDSAARAESPPPPPQTEDHRDDASDSTATADSELEEVLRNTRRNSGSLPNPAAIPTSGMKAPYNPFARTLATPGANTAGKEADDNGRDQRPGVGRPALDVDAFKNILMTGSAVPSPPTGRADTTASVSRQHDSSSTNTDTSSLFDPSYSIHPESPRTSFDEYDDASENEGYEDENSSLRASGSTKMDDMAPPAPPKSSKSKGPQTVSFAEFNQSIPPEFQSVGPPPPAVNHHLTSILRPSLSRSHSDLNKPLPPPPKSPAEPPPPVVPEKDSQSSQQDAAVLDDSKRPPPPPPARRKVGEGLRPRSGSNHSDSTTDSPVPVKEQPQMPNAVEERSNKTVPPVPPPARKTHSTTPSIAGSKDPSPNQSTNNVAKLVPPPPPRRTPSKLGRNENQNSAPPAQKPGDAFLSSLVPNQKTPPAPPPRRAGGGSKRSSLDSAPDSLARRLSSDSHHRRTSGNSFDSERSTSISSLQKVPEPGEIMDEQALVSPPPNQRDILADMSAFQAEIDALRQQSEGTR